jgi:hypothetical protein
MCRSLVNGLVVCGILATAGCGEPGPTDPGGGFQLPPEAKKAQEEAAKLTPEQQMEMMKNSGKGMDPTKKK